MRHRFGEFELDFGRYELRRGGEPVHLEPRVFELLAYLVERRGRLVSKAELVDRVWSGAFVSDAAITGAIRDARRALGQSGDKLGWIRTVHGRGFLFDGPVEALGGRVAGGSAPVRRTPPDSEAYRLYLQGRHLWTRRSEELAREALARFGAALAIDPGFALAHVAVADAWNILGFYCWEPPGEAFPRARGASCRALAIAPELAPAHAALAYGLLYYYWDFAAAEDAFRRALDLDEAYMAAHQYYFNLLTAAGRFDEALAQSERTLAIEPLWAHLHASRGWILFFARRPEPALEALAAADSLDPGYAMTRLWRGWTLERSGRQAEAIVELEAAVAAAPGAIEPVASLAFARAGAGDLAAARATREELVARSAARYVPAYYLALLDVALGDRSAAFVRLERAFAERSHLLVFLGVDPRFDALRDDPRFAVLVGRVAPIDAP